MPERILDLQVDLGDVGERIDRFIAARVRSLSRTFVADLIARGLVVIDGDPARRPAQKLLRPGRVLVRVPPSIEEAPCDLTGRLLHADEALVAIDKPAGLPVNARLTLGGEDAVAATRRLLGLAPDAFLGTPHRLDRDTSGVLVIARTRTAARALTEAFAGRRARKSYLAWVEGVPEPRHGAIDAPILAIEDGEPRIDPRGLPARTRFRVVAVASGRALVSVLLLTGRTHQIRLHFAHAGHPVCGDPVHGRGGQRLLLHARRLSVPHPGTGRRLTLVAPRPSAFEPASPAPGC